MISIVIDLILLIILTELFCILAKNPDIRAVFSMLHELEGMGGDAQSFADAYYAFLVQFMRIYQFFLKILISYKGITMMLLRGKTIGMLVNGIALVSRKDEEYHIACLRYLGDALLTALLLYVFNSVLYIMSLFFIFRDDLHATGVERICGLKLIESR